MSDNTIHDQLAAVIHMAICDDSPEECREFGGRCQRAAGDLDDKGWRPPARVIETAEALADEPTGTVLRSRHGDIASVDHGPHGDWLGTGTQVHFLGPGTSGWLTVGDLIDPDMAGSLPWTVLWQPEVDSHA